MAEPAARLRGVHHTWAPSGVQACNDVNIDIGKGSVHALVGENGAGKTTLGHILAGLCVPDRGRLAFRGNEENLGLRKGPRLIDGIGIVRQYSLWPESLNVWEAAILGRQGYDSGIGYSKRTAVSAIRETAERWGLQDIEPERPVSHLDAAALQRNELAVALMYRPDLLILDEPAAAWEEGRSREFNRFMELVGESDLSLLLVTHRIDDVFRLADHVTVMRSGEVRFSRDTADTDRDEVITEMFGGEIPEASPGKPGTGIGKTTPWTSTDTVDNAPVGTGRQNIVTESVLDAEALSLSSAGKRILDSISFRIKPGEILALTGLKEEGLSALEDVITGNKRPDRGRIRLSGVSLRGATAMRRAGMRYIPSDKTGRGASLGSTMAENMLILDSDKISFRGILSPARMTRWTDRRRRDGRIDGTPNQKMAELSGGNIQKVILEREFHGRIPLIIAANPTWGLDERSRQAVHRRIRRNADEGTAVLLLSADLDEAIANADFLGVVSGGRLSEIRRNTDWTRKELTMRIASTGGQS